MLALGVVMGAALAAEQPWEDPQERLVPGLRGAAQVVSPANRGLCYPSGLRVFAESARTDGVVRVGTVVGVGSGEEADDEGGLAHLVEHLWFRSTQDGEVVQDRLNRAGAWNNAMTTPDRTTVLSAGLVEDLHTLLRLEAARLVAPLAGVDEATFAVEREVVRHELRGGHEVMGRLWFDVVMARHFPPEHPYARPVIGTHASLDGLTLTAAQDFVARWYRPEHASVHLSGDLSLAAVDRLVQDTFPAGLLAASPGGDTVPERCEAQPVDALEPPLPVSRRLEVVRAPVSSSVAMLSWVVPSGYADGGGLLETVLRLFEIAAEDEVGREVTCGVVELGGLALATCETAALGGGGAALDSMLRARSRIVLGLGPYDWQRTFSNIRRGASTRLIREAESAWAPGNPRPFETMAYAHYTGESDFLGANYGRLATPTIEMARGAIDAWFTPERAVRTVVRPGSTDLTLRPGLAAEPLELPPLFPDQPAPQAWELAALARRPDVSEAERTTLDNGLEVVVLRGGVGAGVELRLVLPGGALVEPAPGAATLGSLLLDGVFGEWNHRPMSVGPELLGGAWLEDGDARRNVLGVAGDRLNLDGLSYLLRRQLEQARVDHRSRGVLLRRLREALDQEEEDPQAEAARLRLDRLVGDHPGRDDLSAALLARLKAVPRDAADAWLAGVLRPEGATLVVTGATDLEMALPFLDRWLSDWTAPVPGARPVGEAVRLPPPPRRQVLVLDTAETSLQQLDLTCQLSETGRATLTHRLAARWIHLALVRELREARGLAYSPFARETSVPGGGVLLEAGIDTGFDTVGPALRLAYDALERLAAGEVSEAALAGLKRAEAAAERQSFRTAAGRFALVTSTGAGAWPDRMEAVQVEDLSRALDRCVGHEVVTIVGPGEPALASLQAAGFGEVTGRAE